MFVLESINCEHSLHLPCPTKVGYSTEQLLRNIYENFQQDTALANTAENSVPTVQAIFNEQIMAIIPPGCESV
jgi:hypothetical protein